MGLADGTTKLRLFACPKRQLRSLVVVLCVVALCLAVYWPAMGFDFVNWDDDTYIKNNPNVTAGLSWRGVRWAFDSFGYQGNSDPLTWISHMLDVQLFGLDPWGHHLTSVAFHALNGVILFLLLARMTSALWRSAFVVALFVVHPLHVESVAWISERKDVLSTFFGLLTIAAYLRYVARPTVERYLAVPALFALALLSKPMLMTLPGVLLLLDFWPLGRLRSLQGHNGPARTAIRPPIAKILLEKAPLICLSGAAALLAYRSQDKIGTIATIQGTPIGLRIANSFVAYVEYLHKTVLPRGLAFLYPFPEGGLPLWQPLFAAAFLVLISIAAIVMGRRHPYLPVGWLWYLGTLLPVVGLVQIGSFSMADRFTYVPLIGIFLMVGWGLASFAVNRPHRIKPAALACAVALLALAWTARVQCGTWRNDYTLFGHAIEVTSGNWLAYNTLALTLAQDGRFMEAIEHYEESIRIRPNYGSAHNNLGQTLLRIGKTDLAIEHFEAAVQYEPEVEMYRSNLAFARYMKANRDQRKARQ
jgi:hypothetical protein